MAYDFDFHIARRPIIREKREKGENEIIKNYKSYRKPIYNLTKWLCKNRHKQDYHTLRPDNLSHIPDSLQKAFDNYIAECIHTIQKEDILNSTNDVSGLTELNSMLEDNTPSIRKYLERKRIDIPKYTQGYKSETRKYPREKSDTIVETKVFIENESNSHE